MGRVDLSSQRKKSFFNGGIIIIQRNDIWNFLPNCTCRNGKNFAGLAASFNSQNYHSTSLVLMCKKISFFYVIQQWLVELDIFPMKKPWNSPHFKAVVVFKIFKVVSSG